MRTLPAGKFKDRCPKLLDEVARRRTPVIVTKWGRPVARLMPLPLRTGARAAMVAGRGASGARETGPGYAAAGAESKSAPGSGAQHTRCRGTRRRMAGSSWTPPP